jgi:hypothetical protein
LQQQVLIDIKPTTYEKYERLMRFALDFVQFEYKLKSYPSVSAIKINCPYGAFFIGGIAVAQRSSPKLSFRAQRACLPKAGNLRNRRFILYHSLSLELIDPLPKAWESALPCQQLFC